MSSPSRKITWFATSCVLVAIAVGMFHLWSGRGATVDPDFDTTVPHPAYPAGGPVVLYDEGHENTHTTRGGYRPFADLIRNDGYDLRVAADTLTAPALDDAAVLVIVLARGANDANDDPAFTDDEVTVIDRWVRDGGSLLLVTDHWPYGAAAASLASRFEVQMGRGLVEDPRNSEPVRGASHLVFSEENGLLREHPITRGRDPGERIRRILTFTGQSILGPPGGVSFLALSSTAIEYPPQAPRVEAEGGNVRVTMNYGDPVSAEGRAQGVALAPGRGRVVVLGEAGMLRAERIRGGERVGMNVDGYDNRQLALNVMHWLTRLL